MNNWMLQLQAVKVAKDADEVESTQVKENMYLVIVEGFQLLSEWTGRVWEQCAWKFSRPAKDATPFDPERSKDVTDYEKVSQLSFHFFLNCVVSLVSPLHRSEQCFNYVHKYSKVFQHILTYCDRRNKNPGFINTTGCAVQLFSSRAEGNSGDNKLHKRAGHNDGES
jgi:hypothetical protein